MPKKKNEEASEQTNKRTNDEQENSTQARAR